MTRLHPTDFPELNEVLENLLTGVRAAIGGNLVGLYLQGSIAVGDFDRHSDADFVAVTERELTQQEVATLQTMHGRIFDCGKEWATHLEGSYFPRALLRDLSQAGTELWYLDNGHRELKLSNHCNTVVVRWILRERGVVLTGPSPDTLITPIPAATIRVEIAQVIGSWGRDILAHQERYRSRFYQSFIVLQLSRMLHDLRAGSIGSKRTGAEWAKQNLSPAWSDLIDRAWSGRPNPARSVREPANPVEFERTLRYVEYVVGESQKISGA